MAEKSGVPMPVDTPLAKAYLREFNGMSTAYPPGLSDPSSLRVSENILVSREGGAGVRPGLRSVLPENIWLTSNFASEMVGGFEHFFLNDGRKALLFAARLTSGVVGFKVAVYDTATKRFNIHNLKDPGIDFVVSQGESELNFTSATTFVKYLQIDNKILALSDGGEDLRLFNVGAKKSARKVTPIQEPKWTKDRTLTVVHPTAAWINNATKNTKPTAQTPTTQTLIATGGQEKNEYNYGFFYTFENEIGESAASQITMMRASRAWSQWQFYAPDSSGNKSTTAVTDPAMAMDQLVASMPESVFNQAKMENAIRWNLYMFTWSNQDAIPSEALLIGSRDLSSTSKYQEVGWIQATAAIDVATTNSILPTAENRFNYSDPSSASQGLVAGDRLILVNDRKDGALIRWSSNLVGEYTNFTPSKNGGKKTLTSGNLLIPVAVKLWQNPQSVDTITILCTGVDGYSTSYYMAPADVSGNTSSTFIMGFEETTATPGTVSPYGVEVFNNALYHPLDTELMKSTANNYNITHTTMTADIANLWTKLLHKENIISSQHDSRLYYLVHNPYGEELKKGCKGNEIWVYDGAKDAAAWNRWLVQGISLSKLEVDGRLFMSVSRPEGIFVFDEEQMHDDVATADGTLKEAIPWRLETNTQGANRAHDVYAFLQQMNVTVGNARGSFRVGLRGQNAHGHLVNMSKVLHFDPSIPMDSMPFDHNDSFRVEDYMKEWVFWAESIEEDGKVVPSYGQINYVQYTLRPASVNIGYEEGSLESFEYRRDVAHAAESITVNGVTRPWADNGRP